MIKAVLIEDNPSIQRLVTNMLQEHQDVVLIGVASDVDEGVTLLESKETDIVFLDIEMPDGDGFDVLRKLSIIDFQVVFITAHEKYALKAIKFSALDFLLKPIKSSELLVSIRKARVEIDRKQMQQQIQTLMDNLKSNKEQPLKIVVKDKYGLQVIAIEDIIRLEGDGNYTTFFINNKAPVFTSKGLKEYENLLEQPLFFKSHQSHMVNLAFLDRYDRKEGDQLFLSDGSKIPLATRRKDLLLERLEKMA